MRVGIRKIVLDVDDQEGGRVGPEWEPVMAWIGGCHSGGCSMGDAGMQQAPGACF